MNGIRLLSRRAGVLVAAGLVVFAGTIENLRAAENRRVVLDYAVYVGGWETIRMSFETRLEPETYRLTTALDGQGVLNWWFDWKMSAWSEGRLANGKAIPVRAGADSQWRGKNRKTRLNYPATGLPVVNITPPPQDDNRDPVPDRLRHGTRDLAGAVLTLLTRIGREDHCDMREPVFDGRRRYDLVLTGLGREHMPPIDYSAFSGDALKCSLRVDAIAGYRRDRDSRSRWRKSDTATIWIARVFEGAPPLPVRMQLDTMVGAMIVHLVNARYDAGKSVRRLSANP